MARVLMVWEMGSGMGHMDRMLITARALRDRGHEVRIALRDLSRAHTRIAADGFMMMQTPVWLPQMGNPPRLGNYAAVLASAGWLSPVGLAGLVVGWRSLFALNQPDLIICDHAPTAILASRGSGILTLAMGNSFELPPLGDNFPAMAYWVAGEHALCPTYDSVLLGSCNKALEILGEPPLAKLTDLFAHTHQALVSMPEFNHYAGYRTDTKMLGPAYIDNVGIAPVWPVDVTTPERPKIFAYLSPTYFGFEPLMHAIKASGLVSLIHAKGISAQVAARLGGSNMRFESTAVRMDEVLKMASIVVSHASLGTVCAAALAGKIQLGLPQHTEQEMVSRRLIETGVGLAVPSTNQGTQSVDFGKILQRLINEPSFAVSAKALAQKSIGLSSSNTGDGAVEWIESFL
jgi:UDP-N-acetylglucosamine transferase subunit ALG13